MVVVLYHFIFKPSMLGGMQLRKQMEKASWSEIADALKAECNRKRSATQARRRFTQLLVAQGLYKRPQRK